MQVAGIDSDGVKAKVQGLALTGASVLTRSHSQPTAQEVPGEG